MIPKKIHLIWFGGERPKKFDVLVDKIKEINFDYEIIEWNDNNIDFELINKDLFHQTENLGAKSDIFRFEVLYKYGGIYMDYDFLQIKKFDDLLSFDFFAGTDSINPKEVWNSILGSVKENEICQVYLNTLIDVKPILKNQTSEVMNQTGPYKLTKIIYSKVWQTNYKIFVGDYFFSFPGADRHSVRNLSDEDLKKLESYKTENTYCIHIFTTTWQ